MDCSPQKVCCFITIFVIIGLYLLSTETHLFTKDESTLEKDAPKCIPIFHDANSMIQNEIDSSRQILRDPDVYGNISAKCEEAIECVESNQISMKSYYLDGKYNPCMFFSFYNGQFSTCARALIAKVGDQIPCIERVFHEEFKKKTEKCEAWKMSQPCIVRAILNACDTTGARLMGKKQSKKDYYADEIYNLTPGFCMDL